MHHTGGRGDPTNVVADWRAHRPGIGTQYIMDREGHIHDVRAEYGYGGTGNIITGSGVGRGLNNSNIVGMEVVARDDRDVTPAQVAAAQDFIARNYPGTPVFGHGEVNPGHREASEGMMIVNAIRRQRAAAAAAAQRAPHDSGGVHWPTPPSTHGAGAGHPGHAHFSHALHHEAPPPPPPMRVQLQMPSLFETRQASRQRARWIGEDILGMERAAAPADIGLG
jgi:hypothetical protein